MGRPVGNQLWLAWGNRRSFITRPKWSQITHTHLREMANPGFSYAQAAKRLPPSSNVSSLPASSASSDHGAKDAPIASDTSNIQSKTSKGMATLSKPLQPARAAEEDTSLQTKPPVQPHTTTAEDAKVTEVRQTSQDEETNTVKSTATPAGTAGSTEEQTNRRQGSSDTTDAQEKAKEADDDWEKVSIPSSTAEKELKAAPIPTVNIWAQRSQTFQAKLKEQAAQRQPVAAIPQSKPRPSASASDDSRRKTPGRDNVNGDTTSTPSGRVNANDRVSRQPPNTEISPKSTTRTNEGSVAQQLPPVDAESWPTPETAIVDASRRSSTREQGERGEATDTRPSNRKKEWTAMPFVPSVKFETQMPGAARRGGRPANSRGGGRGGIAAQGERPTEKNEPGSMGPPPLPKTASDQDRGRKGNAARPLRASSVPNGGPGVGGTEEQQPLSSIPPRKDVGVAPEVPAPGTQTTSAQAPSRSSSRQPAQAATTKSQKPESDMNPSQMSEATQSPVRQSQQGERPKGSNGEARGTTDLAEKSQGKEWQKERSGNGHKSDGWRARGERSDRGRGSHRGRGGHAGYNNPSFTSPLPQNGFEAHKQGGQPDVRARQQSQPFGSPYNSARSNPRSQSIPIHTLQGNGYYQPGPGFSQALPPIQTDIGYSGYGQMPTGMPNGIMSAMPYNEQLNGFALISMVVTQL